MTTNETESRIPPAASDLAARRGRQRCSAMIRTTLRFVAHYLEMVIAMAAGMILLYPLWTLGIAHTSPESLLQSVEAAGLMMATTMSAPMVVWMRLRGHGWAPALEMSAAMYAGFVVLYPALWTGALDGAAVEAYGHLLMLVFMLLAMLWRRQEYASGHHRRTPSTMGATPHQELTS